MRVLFSGNSGNFTEILVMNYRVEDLEDTTRFRLLRKVPYTDLMSFVLEYIGKRSAVMALFWTFCIVFLMIAVYVRFNIHGTYQTSRVILHSVLGLIIFPLLSVPVHEALHIVPYYLGGARDIRAGMDLRQYLVYVTAHRHVTGALLFKTVATFPFTLISIALLLMIYFIPGLWKWSLSLFLFAHATMCAGDFALLNFYYLNKGKKIYTWDDADTKDAYFYERLEPL